MAIAFGAFAGFILSKLINSKRTKDNRLILTISMIFFITGFCSALDISPLLACMAMGTAYINISQSEIVFEQINNFSPPILTTFFVLSGMRLSLPSLVSAGIIGVAYFSIRIIGKYMGAYIGGTLSKATPEVTNYLGLALVPQAGVSIGLAFLGYRMLPEDMGSLLLTIILSSGVLYEMVGPAIAKLALYLSKSIPSKDKAKKRFFHATNVQHINHQNTINY